MAYKKIDREFCLTDDSVNVYGYRLMTGGLQLDRFTPAIGYLMHDRARGVAVRWEDFRTEQGRLYAKPVVNGSAFPELAQQIEDGFYSAASVGHIVALEMSDDEAMRLEGQTGPTVLKWFPRECSIVDIPGNYNAIARLYDEADNVLHDLSDNLNTDKKMAKTTIEIAALGLPDLSADATVEEVQRRVRDLIAEAARVPALQKELDTLKAKTDAARVQAVIDRGLAERRLTRELADRLKEDYASNPEGLDTLVASMPKQTVITPPAGAALSGVPEKWRGKTRRELYLSNELEALKAECPDYYNELIKNRN